MVTYTWGFPVLGVVFNEDSLQNVIQTVNWTYTATEDTYIASCYGSLTLGPPNPASFTPYDQVTEDMVISWTEEALGAEQVAAMQQSLAGQIEAQKNPTSGNLPPPWVQPAAE